MENKTKLKERLCDFYNDNKLDKKGECLILDTLEYLGFDIKMI